MSYSLKNTIGITESVIDDNCGLSKFYSIANILSSEFKIDFIEKHDEFHSVEWTFKYKKFSLKLHFNIYHGVTITSDNTKNNSAIVELTDLLKSKVT